MQYKKILCGGTFDHLHTGHVSFLQFAFTKGKKVIIGITSDAYTRKYKNGENIEAFVKRKKMVEEFLQKNHFAARAVILSIDEPFGATQNSGDENTALLVSSETYANGLRINSKRIENNLPPLPLVVFPLFLGEHDIRISSTNIRNGISDKSGKFLLDNPIFQNTVIFPSLLRDFLHKPFGTLFAGDIPKLLLNDPSKIVAVGDVTTKRLHQLGVKQRLSVIDFSVERKKTHETLAQLGFTGKEEIIRVKNVAGQLQENVWKILQNIVKKLKNRENVIIEVDGEEDLFVIPLILFLPLGYVLFYGQPKEGIVAVEIDMFMKDRVLEMLTFLEKSTLQK